MGYSAETTHFGIPLPTGSDLTTPMDYNESAQDVDTALFNAQANSDTALQKANSVEQELADTNTEVTNVKGRVTTLEQTAQTQGTAISNLDNRVTDVKADALDMICAVDEGTAQIATIPVENGKYFRYNDVLYMATANIAVGDTIVPNTNCRATNVATELENAGGGTGTVDAVARAGVQANSLAIGNLSLLETTDKADLVSAINEVLSQIGGGGMPALDFANPLHTFSSGNLSFTASKDCYIYGTLTGSTSANSLTINNTSVAGSAISGGSGGTGQTNVMIPVTKISNGDVISVTSASSNLHVYDVIS